MELWEPIWQKGGSGQQVGFGGERVVRVPAEGSCSGEPGTWLVLGAPGGVGSRAGCQHMALWNVPLSLLLCRGCSQTASPASLSRGWLPSSPALHPPHCLQPLCPTSAPHPGTFQPLLCSPGVLCVRKEARGPLLPEGAAQRLQPQVLGLGLERGVSQGRGLGAESCRGGLFSVPWVVGSHLCLKLQVMSHLGRLEIVFLSNVPKEIRSTEMAEIPSEPGAEQATEQGVGRGKSCSILTRVEGRAGGSSALAPPQIPPG